MTRFDQKTHLGNAREEQGIDDESRGKIHGVDAVIGDAAWRVNWTVSKTHPQQAQHDALQALVGVYGYATAVAMETLRRIDPAAAERVAAHLNEDDDGLKWESRCEDAWAWEQSIRHLEQVDPMGRLFPQLAGQTECPSCHTRDGHPHTEYCQATS